MMDSSFKSYQKAGVRLIFSGLFLFVFSCFLCAQDGARSAADSAENLPKTNILENTDAVPDVPEPLPAESVSPDRESQPVAAENKKHRVMKVYKVWIWQESRDCLWNLAKKYYGNPRMWKKIYLANKDRIEEPSLIYPKQELIIPYPEDLPEKGAEDGN